MPPGGGVADEVVGGGPFSHPDRKFTADERRNPLVRTEP